MMKAAIVILFFCILVSCDEVVYLRNDEKPVLVLYAILEAGCDSMRIELTETKGTYDKSPWRRFPEAEVRVYEEGELLGMAEYRSADSSFVLWQPVKAERTYRIEARVAGKETVWGETHVPEEITDCRAELWYERKEIGSPRWTARHHWTDTFGKKNYYWFCADNLTYDHDGKTLIWQEVYILDSDSPLPDQFNRWSLLGEGDEYTERGYSSYIRVEDIGMDGYNMQLSHRIDARCSWGQMLKVISTMLNVDQHLDAYQKFALEWQYNAFPFDDEFTWTLHYVSVYSNVHGGGGLVASYSSVVTLLEVDSDEEGLFGPGERIK